MNFRSYVPSDPIPRPHVAPFQNHARRLANPLRTTNKLDRYLYVAARWKHRTVAAERARCRPLIGRDVRSILSWDGDVPPSIDRSGRAGLDHIVQDQSTVSRSGQVQYRWGGLSTDGR